MRSFRSMTSFTRTAANWKLRTRSLELGRRTLVMGIINITPDSFSDGGLFLSAEAAVARCMQCLDEGADMLDLGAESTRPCSTQSAVSAEEEQQRLLPVIEGILKAVPHVVLSADTYKSATARAAIAAGVEIINDVSGFTWDDAMPAVCAQSGCGVVLMHTRGRPEEWRGQSKLAADVLMDTVRSGLSQSMETARNAGIAEESVVVDPGYGFGKKFDENYDLLARQGELLALGRPILAGVSRKSFLGHALSALYGDKPVPAEARETASIAAVVVAILRGASIIRVHDVRPAVEAARIADAVLGAV